MKKLLLTLALLVSVLSLTCFAGEVDVDGEYLYDIEFYVQEVVADYTDTTVEVGIDVKRNSGMAGVNYELSFNDEMFTLAAQPVLGTVTNVEVDAFGELTQSPHLGMLTTSDGKLMQQNGRLLTYTFDITDAVAGTYPVEIKLSGTSANGTELKVLDDKLLSVNAVIYNGFITIPGYTISFDTNGGEGEFEAITKTHGKDIILPETEPSRDDYDFLGWSTNKNASEAQFEKADTFDVDADTVLYAVWKKKPLSADTVEFTVSSETATAGEQVVVTINVTQNPGFNALVFYLDYDKTRLEYVTGSFEGATGTGFSEFQPSTENDKFQLYKYDVNYEAQGAVATLTFNVLDSAPLGEAYINIEPVKEECTRFEDGGSVQTPVKTAVNNGAVVIKSAQLLGDINLDGTVDIDDAILLFQHSMMSGIYPIDYVGDTDFTKDGNLDIEDVIRLFQYSMMPEIYPLFKE